MRRPTIRSAQTSSRQALIAFLRFSVRAPWTCADLGFVFVPGACSGRAISGLPLRSSMSSRHAPELRFAFFSWALRLLTRAQGLWNLFLSKNKTHKHSFGAGLSNLGMPLPVAQHVVARLHYAYARWCCTEYAPLCEIMGRSVGFAPEIFNCSGDRPPSVISYAFHMGLLFVVVRVQLLTPATWRCWPCMAPRSSRRSGV